eukprot:m.53319 g.53319  ORF g.53319 m.53319 type:complete len:131 (+) comp10857_c0_seq2:1864-2256(+)
MPEPVWSSGPLGKFAHNGQQENSMASQLRKNPFGLSQQTSQSADEEEQNLKESDEVPLQRKTNPTNPFLDVVPKSKSNLAQQQKPHGNPFLKPNAEVSAPSQKRSSTLTSTTPGNPFLREKSESKTSVTE